MVARFTTSFFVKKESKYMKKIKKIFFVLFLIILLMGDKVYAHPGRTDSSGCHYCKTNCSSWGLYDSEYHCHNGNTYTNSKGQVYNKDGTLTNTSNNQSSSSNNSSTSNSNSNNSNSSSSPNTNSNSTSSNNKTYTPTITYVKSSISTLSTLKVDDYNIPISDKMNLAITNSMPIIIAIPTSNKASVKINKNEQLEYGNNEVTITVIAEDSTTKEYKLNIILVSNDSTLKSIKINGKNIDISDEMNFSTKDSAVDITATPNNQNAKVVYERKHKLNTGENKIVIKVQAEDQITTKEYMLNIKREKVLSSNTAVRIFVNDEEVKFNNYNSHVVYISHDINKINIEYELSDENAKIDLEYHKNINVGKKIIRFKVAAENGKEQEYVLNIYRYKKNEETIYGIIGLLIIGGMFFGIYKLFKKFQAMLKNKFPIKKNHS